jgi:sterol 3beta-glucosyltransferase
MSRIVIAAIGSRGDVAPLTGIGVRLQQQGHDVALASYAEFGDLVRGCGLRFLELDPARIDADPAEVNPIAGLRAFFAPSGQRAIGDNMIAALRDEPADVLLLSPLAELAGHPLAEANGVPGVGVRLQPLSATAEYPPAVLGAWMAGRSLNRASSNAGAWMVDRLYGRTVGGFRKQLGLHDVSPRALRRRRTGAGWPILYGYSSTVLPRPSDWRPGLEVTGYWWPARPIGWQPPEELTAFLDDGPPPVFVGFGSLMVGKADAERMSETVLTALRSAGARGVIQAGWAGMKVTGDDVLTIGEVPHDWLFDRVAAVVHHCGAGTAAGGLRAGVPAVGVPFAGDQPFWARRLQDLGVSSATIPQRRITADNLGAAIQKAMNDNVIRDNAKNLAARLADEDGAGRAIAVVEGLLRSRR